MANIAITFQTRRRMQRKLAKKAGKRGGPGHLKQPKGPPRPRRVQTAAWRMQRQRGLRRGNVITTPPARRTPNSLRSRPSSADRSWPRPSRHRGAVQVSAVVARRNPRRTHPAETLSVPLAVLFFVLFFFKGLTIPEMSFLSFRRQTSVLLPFFCSKLTSEIWKLCLKWC